MSYKPVGHNAVSPYLMVKGADSTIRFLTAAFGGVEILRVTDDAGNVRHAEVRIDDSVIMLSDGVSLGEHPSSHVHIYLANVDQAYAQALAAGATSVQEPMKKDDPDRRGGVRDAGGTTWWIATHHG